MPRSSERVTAIVLEIINEISKVPVESIEPDSKLLEDLGLDSLSHVQLQMDCEDEFDITIDDAVWEQCKTVQQVNNLVLKLVRESDANSE